METKLHKPLVPGRKYYVEMWVVAASKTSFVSNNIGIYFSDRFISNYSSKVSLEKPELAFTPQINSDEIIEPTGGKWTKISGVFTAESQAQYMTIGNFFGRGQTSYKRLRDIEKTESSYYYIDDLLVREANSSEIALYDSLKRFKPGNIWELENISFKPGSTELLSSSASALDGLVNAMQNMPHLQIEISGHTDNKGNEATNLKLSEARAKAVKTYLQGKGISSERVTYKGYGSSRPIAENTTEEGRSRNRRVEIRIISNEQ